MTTITCPPCQSPAKCVLGTCELQAAKQRDWRGCTGEKECDYQPWCRINGRCMRVSLPSQGNPDA